MLQAYLKALFWPAESLVFYDAIPDDTKQTLRPRYFSCFALCCVLFSLPLVKVLWLHLSTRLCLTGKSLLRHGIEVCRCCHPQQVMEMKWLILLTHHGHRCRRYPQMSLCKTSPVLSVAFMKFNILNIMPLKNGKEAYLLGMINKNENGTHCPR